MDPTFKTAWRVLVVVSILILTFGAAAWRMDEAPDLLTDEILYTRAGIRVAGEGALVWDRGEPIFVHPPLYFLVEAVYWRLVGDSAPPLYEAGDIFASVYRARYLNAFFGGLTAVLLYLTGQRVCGSGLGLLLAALFLLDPFGLRINRRAMLETMAGLLTLAGMAVLLTDREGAEDQTSVSRAIIAGLLLGAGLLTKELTFTSLLAVFLFGLWEVWRGKGVKKQRRRGAGGPLEYAQDRLRRPGLGRFAPLQAFLTIAVAGLTYSLYPLWMLATGDWADFVEVKRLSVQRLLGLVQLSGWNRPGMSLADFLGQRLDDYGSSGLLLTLGGVATLWLLLRHRHDRRGRLLGVWGLVLYLFYGFVALFGTGNDQFFYFLLVPAMFMVGHIVVYEAMAGESRVRRWRTLGVVLLLVLILPYSVARWWTAYGVGLDSGYRELSACVEEHLPPGEPLNATGDAIKFQYFFPKRPIASAATPAEARGVGVHYFALAPKDVQLGYGRITSELAGWITAEGQSLCSVYGDTYGEISLYRVDYDDGASPVSSETTEARPRRRSFQPAQGGFVGSFALALDVWSGLVGGLAAWVSRRQLVALLRRSPYRESINATQTREAERERA